MFQRATKTDAKLRLALCGPSGSGKTYSLLKLAHGLIGRPEDYKPTPGETDNEIAAIDTEHGSMSKYADLFGFDVSEPDTYDPRDLVKALDFAAANGYKVFIVDSLSHYWMGKGGELEMVDNAAKRSNSNNTFAAWKNVTPHHNALIDAIISAPIHVLVGMRTKTEWVIEEVNGKKTPRKIGMAPVMRDGIEFEFDVCGDLDQDNNLSITKSRCPDLSGQVINRPGKKMAETLKRWLTGAPAKPKPPAQTEPKTEQAKPEKPPFVASDDDIPKAMGGNHETDPTPPKAKPKPQASTSVPCSIKPWTTMKGFLEIMAGLKENVGDEAYYATLKTFKLEHANKVPDSGTAIAVYNALRDVDAEMKKAVAA
jgi:hypothetical protein